MPVKSETLPKHDLNPMRDARAAAREKFKHFRDDGGESSGIIDPENPPLSDAQLAQMRPAHDVVPDLVNANIRRKAGRPKAVTTKEAVSIRLDADVMEALRASGEGWQTRVNEILRRALIL